MKKSGNREAKPHRHVGIRWRLFICLAAFTVLILLTLWFFQIRLLSYFYEREKLSELREAAADVEVHIADENLDSRVQAIADQRSLCIRLFQIKNGTAQPVADADSNINCVVHHLSDALLADLYDNAQKNGGSYVKRMEFFKGDEERDDQFHVPGIHDSNSSVNVIYVRIIHIGGVEQFLMVDSELTPIRTVINTLQVQFSWSVLLLIFAAFVAAFALSRYVATPLSAIIKKTGELAAGNYDVHFEGYGYREVEELAETLNFAAREIGATDRLQKELIANISHDLRTPLTMIKGYSEVMRDIPGENNAENAQVIIDETSRLSALVSDLLDLSKLQAGTKKPEVAVFDLATLVSDTMQRYEQLVRHEGYSISFENTAGNDLPVLADQTMILQVIYNLINNAVNYTGDSKSVRVQLLMREGNVRFAVADDGTGIAPDEIDQIWDRYYRVDKVHKRAVMGTGLGLSIVKGILESHHAAYGVESALGVGSVFWFELPLVIEEPAEPADI